MKKIHLLNLSVLFFLTATVPLTTHAQSNAPQRFTLEAVLVDNGGNVLYDLQEADLRIWITDGSGETLYEETQHVMVSSGAMSVMVGDGNDSTGTATGGIPYDAMTPDGEKRLNFQIMGDSIPQEEMELGSVPYSYYSQYAIDLPTDTVTTDHILNGTITQDDFSQDLLDYIDSSMTGISEQDLIDHQNEDGAHTARSVSLENTFVNISGANVQEAFENVDHALNIRTTDIDSIETDVTDLQTQITQEVSDRQAGDTTLQQNIDNEATTRANADSTLQSNIDAEESAREAADTALDGRVGTLESTATSLQNQITQEISDRQAGDATLQQNIDSEAATRATADTNLQTQVTTAQTTADNAQSSANAAQSTANSAATAASNAQSSADAAQADVDALEGTVLGHTTTLTDHEDRITDLENSATEDPTFNTVTITGSAPSNPTTNTIYKNNIVTAWALVSAGGREASGSAPLDPSFLNQYNFASVERLNSTATDHVIQTTSDYDIATYKLTFDTPLASSYYSATCTPDFNGVDETSFTNANENSAADDYWPLDAICVVTYRSTSEVHVHTRTPSGGDGSALDYISFNVSIVGGN